MSKLHPDNKKGCVKKQSTVISGVVVLTVSNLLVKMTGLLFKIPMNRIIGDTGMGYYNSAYSIFTLLYMLATSGLPVALSVMISECRSTGKIFAAKRIYRTALAVFALCGILSSFLMLFAAEELARWIGADKATLSIVAAAPTMFFICVSAALKGFFQGCENMVPTAVSQLIESVLKLTVGIAAALYAIRMGYAIHIVAAYAVCGLSLGTFFEMVYLLISKFFRKDRDLMVTECALPLQKPPYREVLARLFRISLPVTLSASVMSLTNTIDTVLIQRLLRESGVGEETAATLWGNYTSLAVPMFNLPPVLVYPIAYSLVPVVASSLAAGKKDEAGRFIENALRAAVILGVPCAMGMATLADPILCLFYTDTSAHMAAPLLTVLAPSSFFVCILALTNSILQGCGKEKYPVLSMLVGGGVKVATSLTLIARYGIVGAPISTLCCYFIVTVVNFIFVVKFTGIRLHFKTTFFLPLVAGVACAMTAKYVYSAGVHFLSENVACISAILLAAIVYFFVLVVFGTLRVEDILIKYVHILEFESERIRKLNNEIENRKEKLKKEVKHDFTSLVELVAALRGEGGCPWDAEQTHASIRTDLIEETYEVVEAIDTNDTALLREELGDVLFQVIFHSRIEQECGGFTVDDVIQDICDKMIFRHPHVFGSVEVDGSGQVLENWEKIKKVEKSRLTLRETLEAVPKQYPSLLRAKKVVKKARKNGCDLGESEDVIRRMTENVASLSTVTEEERRKILTNIIFDAVILSEDGADVEKDVGDKVNDFIAACSEE